LNLTEETGLLGSIPMFSSLEPSKLKLLAFTSEMLKYDGKEILFHIGDSADSAYVIMEVNVAILIEIDNGTIDSITMYKNQLTGKMALFNNATRLATLMANGPLTLLKITEKVFNTLLLENPGFAMDVMRQLTRKLVLAHDKIISLESRLSRISQAY